LGDCGSSDIFVKEIKTKLKIMEKNKYDDYSKTQEEPSLGLELSIVAIVITFIIVFVKISTL
jgi:hypothetical protein